uniref:AlNc14C106G6230 protein n=1 Tax=Albugo laibachii Nc14 TaxID=890382 RepID=F0WI23_9STRA|nr:AlNc14C106G6230 [Albugo laibachii Nc14]|eukprot:CCA20900.1 AlNc14C106G6230 [Albugo laibachii Nc14]
MCFKALRDCGITNKVMMFSAIKIKQTIAQERGFMLEQIYTQSDPRIIYPHDSKELLDTIDEEDKEPEPDYTYKSFADHDHILLVSCSSRAFRTLPSHHWSRSVELDLLSYWMYISQG